MARSDAFHLMGSRETLHRSNGLHNALTQRLKNKLIRLLDGRNAVIPQRVFVSGRAMLAGTTHARALCEDVYDVACRCLAFRYAASCAAVRSGEKKI